LGFGRLFDRWGLWTVSLVMGALGLVVLGIAGSSGIPGLVFGLWLTRGLGQSALSAGSLTLAGIAARNRPPSVMAIYSILLSVGFMIAFPVVGAVVGSAGWRPAWAMVGIGLLALAAVSFGILRRTNGTDGNSGNAPTSEGEDFTLFEALATPAFWVFGLASSVYGLVASGIGLFNESILNELGFAPGLYLTSLAITALTGLGGNFLGGWWLTRAPARLVMVTAMSLLALGLATLPHLTSTWMVFIQAGVMGLAGGLVTVLFFSYWPATFGRRQLGSIQGAAQFLTVVASAAGPLVLARIQEASGSYALAFRILALVTAALGLAAVFVRPPRKPSACTSPVTAGCR
jgi:MFS family permease